MYTYIKKFLAKGTLTQAMTFYSMWAMQCGNWHNASENQTECEMNKLRRKSNNNERRMK